MLPTVLKIYMLIFDSTMEGTVSQIFYLFPFYTLDFKHCLVSGLMTLYN